MPELPEIEAYLAALRPRIEGVVLDSIRVQSFSLLRTFDPPVEAAFGRPVVGLRRLGKRIVVELDGDLFLVVHLMVAGRLHWFDEKKKPLQRKYGLAAFDFATGTLTLTEAGTKRRASLHIVSGEDGVAALDPGGLELDGSTREEFVAALTAERHTLKRALTDARYISGIGGAFADEIMHRARLSPLQMNTNLDAELTRLYEAAVASLEEWTRIRIEETGDAFPEKVTAFHPKMAVHGKYGKPCPVCGAPVQRIVYADRETNYCPGCQTGGKILADRSLSRLLKDDWPQTLEELED